MARYMRRTAQSDLRPPRVVFAAPVFFGPHVNLAPLPFPRGAAADPRRAVHSFGVRPVVVGAPEVFFGPKFSLTQPSRSLRREPTSKLRPPAVLGAAVVLYFGPQTTLAYSRRGRPRSRLAPPVVVNQQPLARPIAVWLIAARTPQITGLVRRQPYSRLRPPAVVGAPVAFHGPGTKLTPGQRRPGRYKLFAPATVGAGISFHGPGTYLTRPSRGRTQSRLRPPAVLAVTQVYYGPAVHLTRGRAGTPSSFLRPPVIPPLAEPTRTTLAPQRRGRTLSELRGPTIGSDIRFAGPNVTLSPQRRGRPLSRLFPPAVINTDRYFGPAATLAYSRRGKPVSHLSPPAVVTQLQAFYGPAVHLTRGKAGQPTSFLRPPVIPPVAQPIRVTLARIRPRPTISTLGVFPPQAVVYAPVNVHLAYSRRGAPMSFLRGLPTGASDVYTGPATWLTYSLRGKPKSLLRKPPFFLAPFAPITVSLARNKPQPTTTALEPPAVVQDAALLFFGPRTELAYSRRGRPLSELKPPAVVGAGRFFRPVLVSLAQAPTPQRAIHSKLRAPAVVRTAVEIYGPRVQLAPSRFPKPESRLSPPAVVGKAPFRPLLVHLAYSRRGVPKPFLAPPTVVQQPPFRGLLVHLIRNVVQPTVAVLAPPLVTREQPFRGLLVHLAYSRRGSPTSFLKPPSVVNDAEAFYGPLVSLTRIKHPPVRWLLKPPTVVIEEFPGDVECDDSTPFDADCSEDATGGFVAGTTTAQGDTISGTDSGNGQTTAGTDRPSGAAEAGDRRT